ncbi:MAG: hypothetical protein V7K42_22580 [Nostoc sp.]
MISDRIYTSVTVIPRISSWLVSKDYGVAIIFAALSDIYAAIRLNIFCVSDGERYKKRGNIIPPH